MRENYRDVAEEALNNLLGWSVSTKSEEQQTTAQQDDNQANNKTEDTIEQQTEQEKVPEDVMEKQPADDIEQDEIKQSADNAEQSAQEKSKENGEEYDEVEEDEQEDTEDEEEEIEVEDKESKVEQSKTEEELRQTLAKLAEQLDEPTQKALVAVLKKVDSDRESLRAEVDAIKKTFGAIVEQVRQEQQIQLFERANNFFDRMSAELPELGKSLPRKEGKIDFSDPAFKTREVIFNHAAKLMAAGARVDDALSDAVAWYRGKYGAKRIVQQLKAREKKIDVPAAAAKDMAKEPTPFDQAKQQLQKVLDTIKTK